MPTAPTLPRTLEPSSMTCHRALGFMSQSDPMMPTPYGDPADRPTLPPGLGSQLGMGFERVGSEVKGACRESAGVHLCWGPAITSEMVRVLSPLSLELAPRGWTLGFTCHSRGNQIPAWEVRKQTSRPRASPSFP